MKESGHPIDDLFKQASADYSVKPPAYSWDRLEEGLKSNHPVDDVFKQASVGYAVKPPAYSWDRIATGLQRSAVVRRMFWVKWAAAIIAVIASFGLGYYFANQQQANGLIAKQNQAIQASDKIENREEQVDLIKEKPEVFTTNSINNNQSNTENNSIYIAREIENAGQNNYTASSSEQRINLENAPVKFAHLDLEKFIRRSDLLESNPGLVNNIPNDLHEQVVNSKEQKEFVYDGTEKNIKQWSIVGLASPIYAYRATQTEATEAPMLAFAEKHVDQTETPIISYSGGMGASYQITKRLSLSSGLYYAKYGQKSTNFMVNDYSTSNFLINTSAGEVQLADESNAAGKFVQSSSSNESVLTQNFNYLEIPLFISYQLFDFEKASIRLMSGIQTGYMVSNSAYIQLDDNEIINGQTNDLFRYSLGTNMGIGMEYKLTPKISLSLIPNLNIGLKNINKQSGVNHFPFAIKVFSGINFKLD